MNANLPGAAVEAGGSIVGDVFSAINANSQRNWEEQMSNTAYTRAVADMNRAGLNPALMYGSGGPASTPSYTPAVGHNPAQGLTKNLTEGRLADSTIATNTATQKKLAAETGLANEEALTQGTQRLVNTALQGKILEESKVPPHEIDRIMKNVELMEQQKGLTTAQTIKTIAETPKSQFYGKIYGAGNTAIENLENGMKSIKHKIADRPWPGDPKSTRGQTGHF